jgi:protein-disulfide isomerase
MKRILPFLIILLVLGVALGGGWYLKKKSSGSSTQHRTGTGTTATEGTTGIAGAGGTDGSSPATTDAASNNNKSTAASNSLEPGASPPHAIGPEDAPVTLEEFGDFECPPCGLLHPELKKIEHEYGPRVRIIFREFPLVPTHQHALAAAKSAEAAGLQGKFWEMHDMLYENQRKWHEAFDVRQIFEDYAKAIGLNVERFKKDIASTEVEQRIFLDGKRAHSLDVKGTPTVFLNGREIPFESLPAEKMRPLIDAELARKQK